MVFDGTSWTDGPILDGIMTHPEEFAGKLVYQTNHAGIFASSLMQFDGKRDTAAYNPKGKNPGTTAFYDYTIDNGVLYGLLSDGRIIDTTDLSHWSVFGQGPSGGRSLGILDGTFYVGGVGGDLWRYSDPLPSSMALMTSQASMFAAVPEPSSLLLLLVGVACV